MKIISLFVLTFSLAFHVYASANNSNSIDSTEIWKEEAMRLSKTDRNASNIVYEKWRKWAQKNTNIKDEIFATRKIGINYLLMKDYDLAEEYFLRVEPLAKEIEDYEELVIIYTNLGIIYDNKNIYDETIKYYEKAIAINAISKDSILYAQCNINYAIFLNKKGVYEKALKNLLVGVEILENSTKKKILASAYNTIGNIYRKTNEWNRAEKFLKLSLSIRKSINNSRGIAGSYNNIGLLYEEKNKLDSAASYYLKAIKIKKELNDSLDIASSFNNLSSLNIKLSNFILAKNYSDSTFSYLNKNNSSKTFVIANNNTGQILINSKKFSKAFLYLNQAYDAAKRNNNLSNLKTNLELQIQCLKSVNQFDNLPSKYDEYIEVSDQLLNKEKNRDIAEMQIRYDVDKQKKEYQILSQQAILRQAELEAEEFKNLLLIVGSIALGMIIIILFIVFRQRSKHNHLLQQLLVEQQHRVKNFLNTIASIFRMHERRAKDDAVKEAVKEGSDRLNAMLLIHQQLDQPSVDAPANLNFTEYTLKLVDQLKSAYSENDDIIKTEMDVNKRINLDVNKAVSLGLILNEVVTNAFKYAVPFVDNPSVTVSLKQMNEEILLSVQDNGPGMPESNLNRRKGSLGLKLIQLFTKNLNASYETTNKNGTLVSVRFIP